MGIACNALTNLPETPVLAAGFNVRYRVRIHAPSLDEVVDSNMDQRLSEAGYSIVAKGLRRTIRLPKSIFKQGVLNLNINSTEEGATTVELNFHRDSKNPKELVEWLSISEDELKEYVGQFLVKVASIDVEEIGNARNL